MVKSFSTFSQERFLQERFLGPHLPIPEIPEPLPTGKKKHDENASSHDIVKKSKRMGPIFKKREIELPPTRQTAFVRSENQNFPRLHLSGARIRIFLPQRVVPPCWGGPNATQVEKN